MLCVGFNGFCRQFEHGAFRLVCARGAFRRGGPRVGVVGERTALEPVRAHQPVELRELIRTACDGIRLAVLAVVESAAERGQLIVRRLAAAVYRDLDVARALAHRHLNGRRGKLGVFLCGAAQLRLFGFEIDYIERQLLQAVAHAQ